jgi:hypothetical protein
MALGSAESKRLKMVFITNRVVNPWLGHPIRLKSLRRKTPEVVMVFRASFGNCVCWTKLREKHWSFSVFSSFVHSEKCWICLDRPFTANWKKNKCSKNREKTSTGEEHSSNDFLFSVQIWLTHPLTEVSTDNWKLLENVPRLKIKQKLSVFLGVLWG